jgi:hypothetical protein
VLAPPRARTRSYARANALTPARRVRRGRVCWATVRSSDKKRKPSEKARERSVSHQRAGLTVAEMSSTFLLRKYYRRNVAADPRVQTRGNRSSGSCVRIPTCLAPHHVVVPVPASRGFRILARRVGARSSVSVPLRAGFSGGCRGCGLVSNPSGTPSGQPPARASRVLFERRSPRRGGNLGRAVDAPEAAVR